MCNDLMKEIDAIVQNTGKIKDLPYDISRHVEIVVNKEKSSAQAICGEIAIVTEKCFLDNSKEREDVARYGFTMDDKDSFILDKYNPNRPVSPKIMKVIHDHISAIKHTAAEGKATFKIAQKHVFGCAKEYRKKMLVICESSTNKAVEDVVEDMLFTGQASKHIDTGPWLNQARMKEKCKQWAFLEADRLVSSGETVVVSGSFDAWYELMPLVVICKMHNTELLLGKTAGTKLSIGNVIDINDALEHFMTDTNTLKHYYDNPYGSIEHFRKINDMISSFVIFPSILHKFLAG